MGKQRPKNSWKRHWPWFAGGGVAVVVLNVGLALLFDLTGNATVRDIQLLAHLLTLLVIFVGGFALGGIALWYFIAKQSH